MAISLDLWKKISATEGISRLLQDSPILPEVWSAYLEHGPAVRQELLLTPLWEKNSGEICQVLWARSKKAKPRSDSARRKGNRPEFAYNQSTVWANLDFEELIRLVLPLTIWWHDRVHPYIFDSTDSPKGRRRTPRLIELLGSSETGRNSDDLMTSIEQPWEGRRGFALDPEVAWFLRMVGIVSRMRTAAQRKRMRTKGVIPKPRTILDSAGLVLQPILSAHIREEAPELVFSISRNRPASISSDESVKTIKADAARRVFKLQACDLTWAVLDTGIDAGHPAFREGNKRSGKTRIKAAYDFMRLRKIITLGSSPFEDDTKELKKLYNLSSRDTKNIERSLTSGRYLDWELLEPALRVVNAEQDESLHPHGTHVAGILGANPEQAESLPNGATPQENEDALTGVCPEINLYDLRVLDDKGFGDEFAMIGALQFVRYLNAHKDRPIIHGVNMSFWIAHDVRDFACGRTPICEECERLVASGVVAVAAAGNFGIAPGISPITHEGGYLAVSITDPGNAEGVITVGATHRREPHNYGVSFFSGRGPTGDGRVKPDLVAPGEKITGPFPGGGIGKLDGTSQAAPHVSGAAALLMARHTELIGQPARVKEILCQTCTDLGRERYFQGHGLIDVLRAIQSV